MSEGCFYIEFKPTIWHRLGFGNAPFPQMADRDGFAEGTLSTRTVVHFDWFDRLRILLSGRVEVSTSTKTDVEVRDAFSASLTMVLPPFGGSV